jgi:uncharacterized membrane protein YjjB (DUF3815 family)
VGRAAAFLILLAALSVYYALHERLWTASLWWDIAFLAFVLIPACFALVWLVLPARQLPWQALLGLAAGFGVLALLLHLASWSTPENFCKLFGVTALGFAFLRWFEELSLIVIVACIIPFVDAYSVFAPHGPTNDIVHHHAKVFTTFSFAFPIPGKSGSANLGLPDLLFFALFLAASARFLLRPPQTWTVMTLSFGATLALAVERNGGLPALPLLAISFLAANADLIWAQLRGNRRPRSP